MTSASAAREVLSQARALPREDAVHAIPIFERAARIANQASVREVEADAELGWAEALFLVDGFEHDSIPHFQRAANLGSGTVIEAMAWLAMGDAFQFFGDVARGLPAFITSAQLFADLDDATGELLARRGASDFLQALNRREEALPHLRRAVQLSLADDEPADCAQLILQLGELLLHLRRKSEAQPVLEVASQVFRQLGDRPSEGRALSHLLAIEGITDPPNYEILTRLVELNAEQAAAEGDAEMERIAQETLGRLYMEHGSLLDTSDE